MKELTIEQKAKRYDEAIEKFDVILNLNTVKESGTIFADDVRKIFPELKESEDERIRKEMITYFSTVEDKELIPYESWIAYLEKQGEQKPVEPQQDMLSQEQYAKAVDECIYGEQKPAWSEEDNQIALSIEQVMNCASLLNIVPEKIDKIRTWLKSLKDRYTWKPSDEQMGVIEAVINNRSFQRRYLDSLYVDLKKLKV